MGVDLIHWAARHRGEGVRGQCLKEMKVKAVDPSELGFSKERLARIDGVMNRFVEQNVVAGAVTLIARHGRIAQFASYGRQNLESGTSMANNAIFRIYSMTKPITAAATMMLFEEGHFRLDDPIADFIPEFANTRVYVSGAGDDIVTTGLERPISIRHLLTHTSGLSYGGNVEKPIGDLYMKIKVGRTEAPLDVFVRELATLPLHHQPGARWTYGLSIDVLGRLIEVVSGIGFEAFLKKRFFGPLGMVDTGFHIPADKVGRLAEIYGTTDGGLKRVDIKNPGSTTPPPMQSGGGGLLSTAADYAQFAQMLLDGGTIDGERLLGRKTVDLMTASYMSREQTPFVPADWSYRDGYGMALGVRTVVDVALSGQLGSEGSFTWQGAAGTDFWVDPREDLMGISMIQIMPGHSRVSEALRTLTYAALTD